MCFKKRREFALYYDELLSGHLKIKVSDNNYSHVVPHIYVVQIDSKHTVETVKDRLKYLKIMCGVYYLPNHYLSFFAKQQNPFAIVERVCPILLTLPLHADFGDGEVDYVCQMLTQIME